MSAFFTIETAHYGALDIHTVKSPALHGRADVSVYKPESAKTGVPVVILLHGVYGSHWVWALKGQAHTTLQKMIDDGDLPPMLLVMPSDGLWQDGSGYLPHKSGSNAEQWIASDVPQLVKDLYPEVNDASPFFISGLSMGGYGALRIGAKYPKIFRAFSGLSSITAFSQFDAFVQEFEALEESVLVQENVLDVIRENKAHIGPFRFDCGRQDPLFDANEELNRQLETLGVPHDFLIHEGGHSWDYWQRHVGETLRFFAKTL